MNHYDLCSLVLILISFFGVSFRRNYFSMAFSLQFFILGLCLLLGRGFFQDNPKNSFISIFFLLYLAQILFLILVALTFRSLRDNTKRGEK